MDLWLNSNTGHFLLFHQGSLVSREASFKEKVRSDSGKVSLLSTRVPVTFVFTGNKAHVWPWSV